MLMYVASVRIRNAWAELRIVFLLAVAFAERIAVSALELPGVGA